MTREREINLKVEMMQVLPSALGKVKNGIGEKFENAQKALLEKKKEDCLAKMISVAESIIPQVVEIQLLSQEIERIDAFFEESFDEDEDEDKDED